MSKVIPRVQSFASLREEMLAVARGERVAPAHAALPSVHSADLIARLLTPENRSLLAVLRSQQPESVAQLAAFTERAPSNLTRTLEKLAAAGLVSFELVGRRLGPAPRSPRRPRWCASSRSRPACRPLRGRGPQKLRAACGSQIARLPNRALLQSAAPRCAV